MSSDDFETEAKQILNNAAAPDADATTIKEHAPAPGAKRRGRPPGSGAGAKKKPSVAKMSHTGEEFHKSAMAINTIIFSGACAFCGTKEAWPEKEREATMDKALARYLELKNIVAPPEAILLQAYAQYMSEVSQKPQVKENVAKRLGGWKGKFSWLNKLAGKFKKNPNTLGKVK